MCASVGECVRMHVHVPVMPVSFTGAVTDVFRKLRPVRVSTARLVHPLLLPINAVIGYVV